jgi:hypothetical protein
MPGSYLCIAEYDLSFGENAYFKTANRVGEDEKINKTGFSLYCIVIFVRKSGNNIECSIECL